MKIYQFDRTTEIIFKLNYEEDAFPKGSLPNENSISVSIPRKIWEHFPDWYWSHILQQLCDRDYYLTEKRLGIYPDPNLAA